MSISENAAQYLSEIFERYTKEFFTSIVNAEQNTLYFGYVGKNNYDVIKVISRSGAFESANRYEDAIVDGERSKVLRSLGMMPTEAITPVPVSEIISMFGAYDTDPQIGALSFSYFTQYLRENMDHPEAREIYKFVVENRQKFVSYENTRMQHKASLLPNIFPDIQEDTMKALVGCETFSMDALEFYGGTDQKHILRRQAAMSQPFLASFFAKNGLFSRTVIEKMKPLNKEIALKMAPPGVDTKPYEATLKKMRKLDPSFSMNGLSEVQIIDALVQIPADWFPKTAEDWDSFCVLVDGLRGISKSLEEDGVNPYDFLFKGCKGQWREFHTRCIQASRDTRPPEGVREGLGKAIMGETKFLDLKAIRKAAKKGEATLRREVEKRLKDVPIIDVFPETLDKDTPSFANEDEKQAVIDWFVYQNIMDYSKEGFEGYRHDLDLMIDDISRFLVLPAAARKAEKYGNFESFSVTNSIRAEANSVALRLMMTDDSMTVNSSQSITSALERARSYQNSHTATYGAMFKDVERVSIDGLGEDEWVKIFEGQHVLPNGVYAECLNTSSLLEDEGRGWSGSNVNEDGTAGLGICVGSAGYDKKCQNNGHHIVSLRAKLPNGSFRRLACIEFAKIDNADLQSDKITLKKAQFKGPRNGAPEAMAQTAYRHLVNDIKSGFVKTNAEQIALYQDARGLSFGRDDVSRLATYDWAKSDDTDTLNNVLGALKEFLHTSRTNLKSVNDLVDSPVLDDLAEGMDPIVGVVTSRFTM